MDRTSTSLAFVQIVLDLPSRADVPVEHDPMRRLIRQHARPATLAAVDAAVIDVSALVRLEHRLRDVHGEHVVLARLDLVEVLGEDREHSLERRLDDDRHPHGRLGWLGARIEASSVGCSTAAL
jgi:hypothetical protein